MLFLLMGCLASGKCQYYRRTAILRPTGGFGAGSSISRTGLLTYIPHSVRATLKSCERIVSSRLTEPGVTLAILSSRYCAISTPRMDPTYRFASGCRSNACIRQDSGPAPFLRTVRSLKYRSSNSATVVMSASLRETNSPWSISYSMDRCRAQKLHRCC